MSARASRLKSELNSVNWKYHKTFYEKKKKTTKNCYMLDDEYDKKKPYSDTMQS